MTLLNAGIDLISFSGILYSIYPPLFAALLVYSIGGTGATLCTWAASSSASTSSRRPRRPTSGAHGAR